MMRQLLLAAAILAAPTWAYAQTPCPTVSQPGAATGSFHVSDGQIIGPTGQIFIARGADIWAGEVINSDPATLVTQILDWFPGLNMVRIGANDSYATDSAAALAPFVNLMTSKGVVVEIGDYNPQYTASVPTGSGLQGELNWATSLATAFKGNPYVWLSTANEPSDQSTYPGATSAEQLAFYNAVRATGNTNMIGLEDSLSTLNPASYSSMTNVHWDDHKYNWSANYATDVSANLSDLQNEIAQTQAIKTADGTPPVIIGELGDSTNGITTDPGGTANVQAVLQSGYGYTALGIDSGGTADMLNNGDGTLTSYGRLVASAIESGSCGGTLPSAQLTTPAVLTSSQPTQSSPPPQTSQPPSQPPPASTDTRSLSAPSSGSLPTRPPGSESTGNVPTQPVVLSLQSPEGDSPSLLQPQGFTTISASGYADIHDADGNHAIAVTNEGNVVVETGGVQDVTISGNYNALELGPYDDRVVVAGTGNVINAGGGVNTIILNYAANSAQGLTAPGSGNNVVDVNAANETQQVLSTPTPSSSAGITLASAPTPSVGTGNIIVLPSPGTGEDIIRGTLRPADRIDLTQALSGTTWDHTASTIGNYITTRSTGAGYVISVGGKVVALFPDGVPGNDITPFLTMS
jgi:hypothetical protein